jgi:ankyrin repeat protein
MRKRPRFILLAAAIYSVAGFCAPIHDAAKEGKLEQIKTLSKKGIKVDALDSKKKTPLYHANSARIALLLINRGANIEVIDEDNNTPLMNAARYYPEVVTVLVEKGAKRQ